MSEKIMWLNRLVFFVIGFSIFAISGIAQTEPRLDGNWAITFYLEPQHKQGATQCAVFTTTRTEGSGEERNGSWMSPTFPGWHGEWQQDGDHAQWYGFTDTAALASSEFGHLPSNSIISGEFNHFLPPDGVTSSAGGWVARRFKACDAIRSSAAQPLAEPRNPDSAMK